LQPDGGQNGITYTIFRTFAELGGSAMLLSPREPFSTIQILSSASSLTYNPKPVPLVLTGNKKSSELSLGAG
tara:strand:- start:602 stop:817 length:216 start_codon:yes stop_codon:yes gene_type:complete